MYESFGFLLLACESQCRKLYQTYKKGAVWAEPDLRHAAELMRNVYDNKNSAKEIGRIASKEMQINFNCDVLGNEIKDRLYQMYRV